MDIPKIKMPQIGGLDGLKDKLGFGGNAADGDDYREYDDYDDGYGDGFDDGYDDYEPSFNGRQSNGYRDIEPIDASSSSRVRPAQARVDDYSGNGYSGRQYSGGYSGNLDLVSREDVRAHTSASANYGRKASGSTGVADGGPATYGEDSYRGSNFDDSRYVASSSARSRGYESLFSDTARASATRPIQVVRPFAYDDVEKVASALRRGDVVVLDLAATDQALYKRILDFSFGAASMVNARVDCLASKIFSIQTGERLNGEEMDQLRSQGVL